jgi:hypothetical protein
VTSSLDLLAPFEALPRFKSTGTEKFTASCPGPLHINGDIHPSLGGKLIDGKLIVKCLSGCSTEDILAKMDLTWRDLFENSSKPVDVSAAKQQRQTSQSFHQRREEETLRCAEELRKRDALIRTANDSHNVGTLTEDRIFEVLGNAYDGYSELEHRFDVLRAGTDIEAHEMLNFEAHEAIDTLPVPGAGALVPTFSNILDFEKWQADAHARGEVSSEQVRAYYRGLPAVFRPENFDDLDEYWSEREAFADETAYSLKERRIFSKRVSG